ncbi:hypothetical protein CLM73_02185 [Achromobacter spanius]|uniref:Uncharacterized protein n=1 Tax=Achromobacter spanius TaxID=217203 RepID=A0A2S0I1X0_9BURK|nr:hypothetical protein CLM73_02185 [Achromobacter spanius]
MEMAILVGVILGEWVWMVVVFGWWRLLSAHEALSRCLTPDEMVFHAEIIFPGCLTPAFV